MNQLVEGHFGHGARKSKIHKRLWRKVRVPHVSAGQPFDWSQSFDIRTKVGAIGIKNQGSSFSCGGQAGAYFMEIQGKLRQDQDVLSAKSIYAPIAYPGGGTELDHLETQIGAHGANLETVVPSYDATGNPLAESQMIDMSWENDFLTRDALARSGYLPMRVGNDIESVASAIRDYGAVIWIIEGQNNGTWLSPYPQPPSKQNKNPIWRHFMCAIGAQAPNGVKQIDALQSWGRIAGDQGIQHFREDYFDSGHITDVFTCIYDLNVHPLVSNQSPWSNVVRWFQRFWAV